MTAYAKRIHLAESQWLFQAEPLAPGLRKTLGVFQKHKEFKSQAI